MKKAEAVKRKGNTYGPVFWKGEIRIQDGKDYGLIEFHYGSEFDLMDAMSKTAYALGYELEWRE